MNVILRKLDKLVFKIRCELIRIIAGRNLTVFVNAKIPSINATGNTMICHCVIDPTFKQVTCNQEYDLSNPLDRAVKVMVMGR